MKYPRPLSQEMSRTYEQAEAMEGVLFDAFSVLQMDIYRASPRSLEVSGGDLGFAHSAAGLGQYVKQCGAGRFFKQKEYTTPRFPAKARRGGYTVLVPPQFVWPWVALVVRLGDLMREAAGSSASLKNLWRPQKGYNRLVAKSGIKSDHPNACGGDFYFENSIAARRAEGVIRGLNALHPELELSLGVGGTNLHVGILSPKGKRTWFYKSFRGRKVKL